MTKRPYIYTIGYSSFQTSSGIHTEKMYEVLRNLSVNFLVDVRSIPFSRQFPQCNSDALKYVGEKNGIRYIHLPELGAKASIQQDVFSQASDIFFEDSAFPISKSNRPDKIELERYDRIVDFKKFRTDSCFLKGINRIKTAYEKGFTLALMCSEKSPMDCHRYFLICKKLEEDFGDWLNIKHITLDTHENIVLRTNEEIDQLLRSHILSRNEIKKLAVMDISMFDTPILDKYDGENSQEKLTDFCDRYWNLIHGWSEPNNNPLKPFNDD